MAQYDKLINLGLLSQFLTKAKTIFAPKITASGILKGDGQGGVTAAEAGADYATPALVKVSDTQPTEAENKLWVDTDGGSGNSYEVPTVAEMQAADNSILGNLAMIESSPATQAHAVGEYIVYNGQLYKVSTAIAQGESLTVGTNIAATNISDAIPAYSAVVGYGSGGAVTYTSGFSWMMARTSLISYGRMHVINVGFSTGAHYGQWFTFAKLNDLSIVPQIVGFTGGFEIRAPAIGENNTTRIALLSETGELRIYSAENTTYYITFVWMS